MSRPRCQGSRIDTVFRDGFGEMAMDSPHPSGAPWPVSSDVPEYSYTPLDVGFDLRAHPDMVIDLPVGDRLRVRYVAGEDERTIEGARAEVASALTAAGYRVVVEPTAGEK